MHKEEQRERDKPTVLSAEPNAGLDLMTPRLPEPTSREECSVN